MGPHQAGLEISYDGTWTESVTEAQGGGGAGSASYTVVDGDSLWGIAKQFYGNGAQYMTIYNANVDVIESTAKAHGKPDSYKGPTAGWWIWAGEVLTIPGASGGHEEVQERTVIKKAGAADPSLGERIGRQATAFSYTDVASGESDDVSITLQDIGKEWLGNLMPKRGASLGAKIVLSNWRGSGDRGTLDCGTFVLDDISFSGRPLSCTLKGVSVPSMNDFRTLPMTRTWERTTVQGIASQIAGNAGVSLYYDADGIPIEEIEQNRQTDSSFLRALCEKYGLAMKAYNHKIVIFDIVRYEEKAAVATLQEEDDGMAGGIKVLSWSSNTTLDGTYTGVNLNYTDPDTEEPIHVTMGSAGRMYAINTQASSRYDAELQAAAKANSANRGIVTMEATVRADISLVASHCVMASGFGNLDGRYYIDRIAHSLGRGYTMRLSMHKVQEAIKVTAPAPSAGGGQTYVVVSGDTLWGISKRFYGTGTKYHVIYGANMDLIESTAKAHGKKGSDNGHWIWPGETLTIPEG